MNPFMLNSPGPVLLLTTTICTALLASIACNDRDPKMANRAGGFAVAMWIAAALISVYIRKQF